MSRTFSLEGLTTEQEFMYAIELIGRCTSSLRCGVDVSGAELDVILLKYRAKDYIKAVEEMPV